jgi:hypothetical protein
MSKEQHKLRPSRPLAKGSPQMVSADCESLSLEDIRVLCARGPVFVFPWACNQRSGFGANHSGLTKCLTMALQKGIGFRLVRIRHPQGIAIARGYTDYLASFCDEANGRFQVPLNRSPLPGQSRYPVVRNLARAILRATTSPRADYFVFDDHDWIPDRGSSLSSVPFDVLRGVVARCLWRYTPAV